MAEAKTKKERLVTPEGIASFVHVFEPHAVEEGKPPKFGLILLFQSKEEIKQLRAKCIAAADERFGRETWKKLLDKKKFRFPWRPADEYEDYGAPFADAPAEAVFCNFSSKDAPEVVDRSAKPIMKASEVYSGMLARVSYAVWAYDSNGNKGVTLLLNNVQKTGKGEKLSGKPGANEDFDAVEGEDGTEEEDDDEI